MFNFLIERKVKEIIRMFDEKLCIREIHWPLIDDKICPVALLLKNNIIDQRTFSAPAEMGLVCRSGKVGTSSAFLHLLIFFSKHTKNFSLVPITYLLV